MSHTPYSYIRYVCPNDCPNPTFQQAPGGYKEFTEAGEEIPPKMLCTKCGAEAKDRKNLNG